MFKLKVINQINLKWFYENKTVVFPNKMHNLSYVYSRVTWAFYCPVFVLAVKMHVKSVVVPL